MKYLMTTLLTTALMSGGVGLATLGFSSLAMADQHRGGQHEMRHDMHGKGHHGGGHWKATLSDEQRKKLDKLKLDFKKKKYPIKAKLKQAKVALALLMTADSPNQGDINKQIDAILKLKGEKMRLKAAHKIKVRKLLTAEQRVKFDMHVLKKAYHCKKRKGHH